MGYDENPMKDRTLISVQDYKVSASCQQRVRNMVVP
jgi:hypothetical protein